MHAYRRHFKPVTLLLAVAAICAAGIVGRNTPYSSAASPTRASRNPVAVAARSVALHETANLHLLSRHNQVVIEEGSSRGRLNGRMWVHLTVAVTVATVTFIASPAGGGTIRGKGEASYYASGPTAHFSGVATISHGTGRYAHVSGSNIQVAGVITRKDYALSIHMSGRMRY